MKMNAAHGWNASGVRHSCCNMRWALFIFIALLIGGCSVASTADKGLDKAEGMMRRDPKGALEILNAYDVSSFEDSASMARWALLYSEALNVNRLAAPTDTIISVAIDFYSRRGMAVQLARAEKIKSGMLCQNTVDNRLATSLYIQKEKEYFLFREKSKRKELTYMLVIVMILGVSVIVWQLRRIKTRQAANDALMAEAAGLRKDLDAQRNSNAGLESKLYGLLENRFDLIDSLCQTYYEWQGSKNERKAVSESVKEKIASLREDETFFREMAGAVDDCCGGLATRLRKDFPEMKPEEFRLAVYIVCGLSSRTISLLLGETVDNVYKRKSRLKARLKQVGIESGNELLDHF